VGAVTDILQAPSAACLGATAIEPGRFVLGTLIGILHLSFTVTGLSRRPVSWINDVSNGAAPLRRRSDLDHRRPQTDRQLKAT
jgi:hypothetical protein